MKRNLLKFNIDVVSMQDVLDNVYRMLLGLGGGMPSSAIYRFKAIPVKRNTTFLNGDPSRENLG